MILVTGAGGKTGRALIKVLSKAGPVCAFVHREAQVSIAKSLGAERAVVGDARDESAIQAAMQTVRGVYHICPNMNPDEVAIGKLVIGAARKAGVEHFVYHSVLHPQAERMPHHRAKLRVEEMLLESGLPFTILQPAPYMQNLLAGWLSVLGEGVLRVPYSVDARFSFVDLEDVAEAAAIVLAGRNHLQATYELAGTFPMSHTEVAAVLSRVLKRTVRVEKQEIGDWRSRARETGMDASALVSLTAMFDYYDRRGLAGNPNLLQWLLGRAPTALDLFVARAVKERNAVH